MSRHKINNQVKSVIFYYSVVILFLHLQLSTCFSSSLYNNNNNNDDPTGQRENRNNDRTLIGFGLSFARMFQDFIRKVFSTLVTVNVNFMGEQTVHVAKPHVSTEPERIFLDAGVGPEGVEQKQKRMPEMQRMLGGGGQQTRPFWPWLSSPSGERKRLFKPLAIFGR